MGNKAKHAFQHVLSVRLFLIVFFSIFTFCAFQIANSAAAISFQNQKGIFENMIPVIAEQYIGVPCEFGNGLKKSATMDNSHLFCLIYDMATKQAGLRYFGYMPMKELLKKTVEVQRHELKNGDLIVLKDSHAAMIYRIENQDKFYMIYASGERQQVISFNSQNVVFEVYWLENLKGFYRLTRDMFLPQD
jgi:hypothetical protein